MPQLPSACLPDLARDRLPSQVENDFILPLEKEIFIEQLKDIVDKAEDMLSEDTEGERSSDQGTSPQQAPCTFPGGEVCDPASCCTDTPLARSVAAHVSPVAGSKDAAASHPPGCLPAER